MMRRIDETLALQHTIGSDAARERFAALWDEIGREGDPVCRCRLAHHLADLQDDPREELAWDLRALEAADQWTDADVKRQHESLSVAAFYPSLHLNVAEDYRKLGELAKAREHAARAEASVDVLGASEYGGMIRSGIARLVERLASTDADGKRD
jgi:hypothetical protein